MDKIRVLLVEDESTLAMIVKETLEEQGFEVAIANDGLEGIAMFQDMEYDVVIADIMMPNMDGFEMTRRIRRADKMIPVLFLSSRSAVEDVVAGFNLGANDYLRKPFSMLELIARIKALVHRNQADKVEEGSDGRLRIGKYTLDTITQILSCGHEESELTHRESEILRTLARHVNEVVETRDILFDQWGDDSVYNAKSLHVFITKLRHKLSSDEDIKIINVRGVGYKMIF